MRVYYWLLRCLDRVRRFPRNVAFYIRYGFRSSDVWSIDTAAARWFIPRLRYLKAHHCGHPADITDDEWTAILGKMIRTFELIAAWDIETEAEQAEVNAGLDLFRAYFQGLWD
jgi:hypothetical protein